MIRRSWQFQRWHGDFLIPCWYFVMGTNASNQKLKAKLPSRASERERVCVYNTYNLKYLLRVFWSSLLHTMRYVRMVILTVVFCVCIFVLFWKIDRSGFSSAAASFSTNLVSKRCIPQVEVEVCLGCKIDSESILWSIIDSESLRECPPKIDSCRDSITTRSLISHLSLLCHERR